MNNKHIPPAVGEFAVGERDQLLARIAEQAWEIERLRLNIADYNEHERCYQAEIAALKAQPDPWKASGADWCRSIHSNPDAMAWTDFFVAVFPGQADKHELMFGWFANAMMAMHDHLKAQPCGVVLHDLRELLGMLLLDDDRRIKHAGTWRQDLHERATTMLARLNQQPDPFCEYVKQSIGGDDAERAAFEAFVQREWPGTSIRRRDALPADHERYGEYVNAFVAHAWDSWQAHADLSAPSHGEQVREGWQLVPVEPTRAMRYSVENTSLASAVTRQSTQHEIGAQVYAAMLATAPSAGSQEQGE